MSDVAKFKEYLAEPRFRIALDDMVHASLREAMQATTGEKFAPSAQVANGENVLSLLNAYEEAYRSLQSYFVLLARWGTSDHMTTVRSLVARASDSINRSEGGSTIRLALRWYPLNMLTYSAGITALAFENFAAFSAVHSVRVAAEYRRGEMTSPSVVVAADAIRDAGSGFASLPGHERHRVPMSEYLLRGLQKCLDDLVGLGASYEAAFDRYEMLRSLLYCDYTNSGWGLLGRYAWKHLSEEERGPYACFRKEVEEQRDQWGPLKAGLFQGSYARFEQTAKKFESEGLARMSRF